MIFRHRAALVRQRTMFKSRVRAVLADRGVDGPDALWDGPGRKWLAGLELPAVEREVVEDLCGLLDAMEIPITRLERQIRKIAQPDPQMRCDPARELSQAGVARVGLITATEPAIEATWPASLRAASMGQTAGHSVLRTI